MPVRDTCLRNHRVRATVRLAFLISIGLLLPVFVWAGPASYLQGTETTWHSGTATLASNAQVLSGTITSTNYLHGYCTLALPGTAGTPAANTAIVVWFRVSTDGTTFPDGDASTTPAEPQHMTFPLRAVTGPQVVSAYVSRMPPGVFKVLIRNDGTGATLNTTWSLKCKPHTPQS